MTAGAWRRRRVGYGRAAGVLVLVALALTVSPALGSRATAQAAPPLPLSITVTRISPTAPQPGDLITVEGQVDNPTATEYDDESVGLRLDPAPLVSRAALLSVVNATDHLSEPVGTSYTIAALTGAGTGRFRLQVPADQLELSQPGVYRLSIEASHDGDDVADGRVDTFLPWLPASAAVPAVQVAWVWPLLSTPHLEPDDTFDINDTLSTEIAAKGRLGGLLDVANQAADESGSIPPQRAPLAKGQVSTDPPAVALPIRPVPVTPVIDPETVQELELMADPATPYQVRLKDGSTSAGTGQPAAASYLANLRQLMGRTSSIALPYADPDIEALAGAGASSLLTQARSTGLEATLPGVVAGLVWPPDGALSENALDQLTTTGLVLSSQAVPLTASPAYTPTAVTTVDRTGGSVPAVVIDDGLSHLVTKQIHGSDRVLIAQRFAAETAAIAVEASGASLGSRALVIAPGRRWSPTNTAVRTLLDETGRLPWLKPETVPQVLQDDQPDPAASRGPLTLPATSGTTGGLTTAGAGQIAAANNELGGFRSILCPVVKTSAGASPTTTVSPTVGPTTAAPVGAPASSASSGNPGVQCNRDDQVLMLQRSLYRTASSALAADDRAALLRSTLSSLRTTEGKVSIVTRGQVNLLGNRARLPITIVDNLTVPVKVQLVLTPRSPGLTTSKAQTVVILAGARPQLDVTVNRTKAGAGTLLVDAQLLTPQGKPFGAPVPLKVRVSAYGAVVVTITVVVCSLLALAVVVRLFRRVRRARRGPPEGPTDVDEPEAAPA